MTSINDTDDSSNSLDSALAIAFGGETGSRIAEPIPKRIGRYRIDRMLGSGGFARVHLAHDDTLNRAVAIKVPHGHLVEPRLDAYLAEARTLAMLDHPHIVPIYDVDSTDDLPCFIVSKFVDGNLAERLRERHVTRTEAAQLASHVADALHHAHKRHLVHRDIKPSNLLLDQDGKVYVADFGIALREDDGLPVDSRAGTPAYMSPEQARGESHRVDGRSDVYSLGVVLYEMIAGRRLFRAKNKADLLRQVIESEPQPPRQLDETIPAELERICLKAMSRHVRNRYTTAHDLAEELRQFLREHETSTVLSTPGGANPPSVPPTPSSTSDQGTPIEATVERIVPKGLRSFDRHDADFFLRLLPGPGDRNGIPESVRFWKTKIEEQDSEQTFAVGLIYGPSGCGKSSFIKAGLLPQLADTVSAVQIDASSANLETQLLNALQRHFVGLSRTESLKDSIIQLRSNDSVSQKILIVIDQFEQWLSAATEEDKDRLNGALRQCDGGRVQCLLLIRDDFWMAITRFFQQLEIRIVEDQNASVVDIFPIKHAEKVLASFGRAFGELSEDANVPLTAEQQNFVRAAVGGLAEDGKVMCVRLALFAEMMRDKSWTVATLDQVGGTDGLGTRFLEEQLGDSLGKRDSHSNSPAHRYHQAAARGLLQALLPKSGADNLKGGMAAYGELQKASGYADRPADFEELTTLLDQQLRLITPVDHLNMVRQNSDVEPEEKHYQLTHDYLVQPIREWLVRKQKQTMRGRAELCLSDHADTWRTSPQNRYLPGFLEFIRIHCLTPRKNRTDTQNRLLRAANQYYGIRSLLSMVCLATILIAGLVLRHNANRQNQQRNANTLVANLLSAPPNAVQHSIGALQPLRDLALPQLKEKFADDSANRDVRLISAFAVSEFDQVPTKFLVEAIQYASVDHRHNLVAALEQDIDQAKQELSLASLATEDLVYRAKLATVLLHFQEPATARWMLEQVEEDPEPRTRFIDAFADWRISVEGIDALLRTEISNEFRSGLFCALAELPTNEMPANTIPKFEPLLQETWRNHDDSGVHSAADLLCRRWQITTPRLTTEELAGRQERLDRELATIMAQGDRVAETRSRLWSPLFSNVLQSDVEPMSRPTTKGTWRSWYINSLGMTMIRMRCETLKGAPSFSISDREVTVGQFQDFIKDAQVSDVVGVDPAVSPTRDHPRQNVSLAQAFRFCNWLSDNEHLTPCYKSTDGDWAYSNSADGYHLTENSEWTFGCAALVNTEFCWGNNPKDSQRYACLNAFGARKCGSLLPSNSRLFSVCSMVPEGVRVRQTVRLTICESLCVGDNGLA